VPYPARLMGRPKGSKDKEKEWPMGRLADLMPKSWLLFVLFLFLDFDVMFLILFVFLTERVSGALGRAVDYVRKRDFPLTLEERTDEALMVQLCQGRIRPWRNCWAAMRVIFYASASTYMREADAQGSRPETFLRCIRRETDLMRIEVRPWLLCIARNLCLNELKRKKALPMEAWSKLPASKRRAWRVSDAACSGPGSVVNAAERRQKLGVCSRR